MPESTPPPPPPEVPRAPAPQPTPAPSAAAMPPAAPPPGSPAVAPPGAPPAPPAPPAAASPAQWNPPARHPIITIALVLVILILVIVVLRFWHIGPFEGADQQTNNAYVRGRTTVIAPQVSGYVTEVAVHDFQEVVAGQVLVRIDDRIYRARVEQAQAQVDLQQANLDNYLQSLASKKAALKGQQANRGNAGAQLERARADMTRAEDLVSDGSISVRERDQTLASLRQAEASIGTSDANVEVARQDIRTVEVQREALVAQVASARAQQHAAQVDLDNTVIRAVEPGRLSEVGVRLGQFVTNGNVLFSLVPPDRWVIANLKEAQTDGVRPGQPVSIKVDALDGAVVHGRIERLSPAAGSEFSAVKPDTATGNFVKIPQRIGVRIAIDRDDPLFDRLSPGMSVEVAIDTSVQGRAEPNSPAAR